MTRINKTFFRIFCLLFLIGAFGIVQYYIWGNAFITEFQADCTDTLFWADASLKSGSLFDPEFDYAYRLAFGGQWLFMPFLKAFGIGIKALRCGMCLFTVIFTLALILFFRSMHCSWSVSFAETALMLLAVCAVKKTREIFFGHIIHYSLAVVYLLLAFVFLRTALEGSSRKKRILSAVMLTLVLSMCSANGTVEMLYVTLPLLAGCLLELYLSRDRKLFGICLCIAAAAGAGFLFSSSLNTGYSDSHSVIIPAENWGGNLSAFPLRWISLFYQLPARNLDAFSPVWIKTVFKIIVSFVILAGMIISFSAYKSSAHTEERIFIFTSWAMFAAFLFFFVFGMISAADWRLIPLFFAAHVVILLMFNRLFSGDAERTIQHGMMILCGVVLIIQALSNGLSVLRIPYDDKIWFAEDGLLGTLKAHGLNYGYITDYWMSNSITVISDDTVRSRAVAWDEGRPYLYLFNSDITWYDDQPGQEKYFLVLRDSEYDPASALAKEASETYTCFQENTRNNVDENYVILVFDRNIMKEEFDNLIGRYR